jgi:very-short-patch-repair endonuclease
MVQYRPPEGSTARARKLRRELTDAEIRLSYLLRQNFPDQHFRRQGTIRAFHPDFVTHRAKLVIEADGSQHGGSDDLARAALIEAEGYRVLRFWNNDILQNPDGVLTAIAEALHDRSPPPNPPPSRGRA